MIDDPSCSRADLAASKGRRACVFLYAFLFFFFEWCLGRLKALSLQFGRFRILRAVDGGIIMPRRPFEYLPGKSSLLLFDTMRADSCKTFFPFWYSQPAFFLTVYFIVTLPRNLRARIWPSVRISLRLFLHKYEGTEAQSALGCDSFPFRFSNHFQQTLFPNFPFIVISKKSAPIRLP